MERDALISPGDTFRYWLYRRWGDGPVMLFIMLNPSTADALLDDPTIRRCIAFAKREGFGALRVINLYAFRATDPAEIVKEIERCDAVGPLNPQYTREAIAEADQIVVAWGAHPAAERIGNELGWSMIDTAIVPYCLGTTKSGAPRHPLYVPGDAPLERWAPAEEW